ncbi:regulatory protein [Streptomyces filamentosus NRRL 11379]|nr:regulatory protein [Streptomyces filamentosus NRRL 11379]
MPGTRRGLAPRDPDRRLREGGSFDRVSTDFQTARVALGARLRELRSEAGLNGKGVAEALGWQRSKVSRLETGKQTPTASDLTQWSQAVGRPDVATELRGRLVGLESQYRSWRRQLAGGHRARQELGVTETTVTQLIRGVEVSRIPGLFQTADYARHTFEANAEFRRIPRDIEAPSWRSKDPMRRRCARPQRCWNSTTPRPGSGASTRSTRARPAATSSPSPPSCFPKPGSRKKPFPSA